MKINNREVIGEIMNYSEEQTCPKCNQGKQSPCEVCNISWEYKSKTYLVKVKK